MIITNVKKEVKKKKPWKLVKGEMWSDYLAQQFYFYQYETK